jgi:hypothetical protein
MFPRDDARDRTIGEPVPTSIPSAARASSRTLYRFTPDEIAEIADKLRTEAGLK